jgi:hypothetical protein
MDLRNIGPTVSTNPRQDRKEAQEIVCNLHKGVSRVAEVYFTRKTHWAPGILGVAADIFSGGDVGDRVLRVRDDALCEACGSLHEGRQ